MYYHCQCLINVSRVEEICLRPVKVGGGVKAGEWGGLGSLKERQNSNYFIMA